MTPELVQLFFLVVIVAGLAGAGACFAVAFPRAARARRAVAPIALPPAAPRPVPEAATAAESEAATAAESEAATAAESEAAAEPEPAPAVALAELEPVPEAVPELPRPSLDLRGGLSKTRAALIGGIERVLRGRTGLDGEAIEEVETVLYGADLGVQTAEDLLETARRAGSPDEVRSRLEARALEILGTEPAAAPALGRPHVVLIVGVNGSGKTTTIGKLAARHRAEGRSVLVAAADTFRAAAIDQLAVWAERSGAEIVKGAPGGDAAAVAFDAVSAARARDVDVVLVDTAGRLQTQAGLMEELSKVARVIRKQIAAAPHEVLLVLDANTGQNAIRQAQEFGRAAEVTGIVLAKLDGTAKGGVVLGIAEEVGIPVRWVGVGEGLHDLLPFDPREFARTLFAPPEEAADEAVRQAGA